MVEQVCGESGESAGRGGYSGESKTARPGSWSYQGVPGLTPEYESEALMSIAPRPPDSEQGAR